jgi:hypothetical protein
MFQNRLIWAKSQASSIVHSTCYRYSHLRKAVAMPTSCLKGTSTAYLLFPGGGVLARPSATGETEHSRIPWKGSEMPSVRRRAQSGGDLSVNPSGNKGK